MAFDSTIFDFPFNHLDNKSFNAALLEMSYGWINFDYDRSESLVFNPIEHLGSTQSRSTVNSSVDPDLKIFMRVPNQTQII